MPRNKDYQPVDIETSKIRSLFHLPIEDAAKNCGICTTLLKRMCRRKGITRWPYRKMKSITRMIHTLEQCDEECLDEKTRARLEQLRAERDLIRAGKHEAVTGGFVPKSQRREASHIKQFSDNKSTIRSSDAPLTVAFSDHGSAGVLVMQKQHLQHQQHQYQFLHQHHHHQLHSQAPHHLSGFPASYDPGMQVVGRHKFYSQQPLSSLATNRLSHGDHQWSSVQQHADVPHTRQYVQSRHNTLASYLPNPPPAVTHHASPRWHLQAQGPSYSKSLHSGPKASVSATMPAVPRKGSLQDVLDGAVNLASLSNSLPKPEQGCLLPPLRAMLGRLDV